MLVLVPLQPWPAVISTFRLEPSAGRPQTYELRIAAADEAITNMPRFPNMLSDSSPLIARM